MQGVFHHARKAFGDQLRFAGGFYAFPGGRVDVDDAAVPLANAGYLEPDEQPCIAAATAGASRRSP